jgi:hypothetical protein
MNSPVDWLLVVTYEDGSKGYINLWQAIEEGRLTARMNPLNRAKVTDACADSPENRRDIDTNFGANAEVKTIVEALTQEAADTPPDLLFLDFPDGTGAIVVRSKNKRTRK